MRRTATVLFILIAFAALYLTFWPTHFDATSWQPKPAPTYTADRNLADISIVGDIRDLDGPEDVEVTSSHIFTGLEDGRVVQIERKPPYSVTTLFNTGGRPLGLDMSSDGTLYIADVLKGILRWKDGQLTVLLPPTDALRFIDDVVVTKDNRALYFSNASTRWSIGFADADILEHQKTGSIIEYNVATQATRTIADKLSFANGVTLGPNESMLYFNETGEYRVWAYNFATEQLTVLADNLPGLPDNISTTDDGLWVALFTPRNEVLDSLADQPGLRNAIYRLPNGLKPKPAHHALAVKLDFSGKIMRVTEDASLSAYAPITAVHEIGNQLYFGSLRASGVGITDNKTDSKPAESD